jgi:aconitate hydratase
MVNGLGVVGWGVGGIEAEAAMLGQPSSDADSGSDRCRLTGRLPSATATDLVLTITEALRKKDVVGVRRVLRNRTRAPDDRGSRDARQHVSRVRRDGRDLPDRRHDARLPAVHGSDEAQIALVRHTRSAGTLRTDATPDARHSDTLELDLSTVEPSLAGPRRPQDRVSLKSAKSSFAKALPDLQKGVRKRRQAVDSGRRRTQLEQVCRHRGDHELRTSNPSVMIAAGLVARRPPLGLTRKPWVKTASRRLEGGHGLLGEGRVAAVA